MVCKVGARSARVVVAVPAGPRRRQPRRRAARLGGGRPRHGERHRPAAVGRSSGLSESSVSLAQVRAGLVDVVVQRVQLLLLGLADVADAGEVVGRRVVGEVRDLLDVEVEAVLRVGRDVLRRTDVVELVGGVLERLDVGLRGPWSGRRRRSRPGSPSSAPQNSLADGASSPPPPPPPPSSPQPAAPPATRARLAASSPSRISCRRRIARSSLGASLDRRRVARLAGGAVVTEVRAGLLR